ncbi:MmgE/PrpD family protein [Jannaschia sp. W003]|uniref:MmgE/PrpD family protein n=1 Tax=Jannaschia sp. W003 TaxID=2867012 RepID=UPI0021A4A218|nr:MmgE/PrpD family protein [Jannaschia sp. W003]UWQ20496.1 MmgE/PrpD family protein [Jannaschia sp. W003]
MILRALLDAPGGDPEGRAMLRLSILDWTACALAGVAEPSARAARALADPGAAALVGGGAATPARAALFNATAGHALDYDDTHFDHVGHVSTVVLPAALALAGDWETFEAAALAGAEGAVRMGVWLGRAHYDAGFHGTATAGAFGATLAAARCLGLDRERTAHALGLCATRASGLKSQFGTDGKPLNAGLAASAGVDCAALAAAGAGSARDALDGPQGFGATHAGEGARVPDAPRFHLVSHKLHACCHGLHAALEAVRAHAGPVDAIEVTTHPRWLRVCDQRSPDTGLGAKFSYRHALALAALGHDTADPATFSDALARDAAAVALREHVTVVTDPALPDTAARVRAGDRVTAHDLAEPMDRDALRARLMGKARLLIGDLADTVQAAIDARDLAAYRAAITA